MSWEQDPFVAVWRAERGYLVNLAFRMLGDIGEAEDVVQEAFTRLTQKVPGGLEDERAWLTVVTTRLCLDLLRSARVRREHLADITVLDADPSGLTRSVADPADRITLDDEVQLALVVLLRQLSPAERVAFILHDVFDVGFEVIATTLGKPVGTCRQLARRARLKIANDGGHGTIALSEHRDVTERFIAACAGGDMGALLAVLHPDVWGRAVFTPASGIGAIVSRGRNEVSDNLFRYYRMGVTLVSHPSTPLVVVAYLNRRLFAQLALTVDDRLIIRIDASVDPGTM